MTPDREACDRCHSIKTRCVKAKRSETCIRCEKLGVPCHYSPAGRTGRPLGSRKRKETTTPATSQETFDFQDGDACDHYEVPSFRENEKSTTSDSHQDGPITDMDFHTLLPRVDNDTLSTLLVDAAAQEGSSVTSVPENVGCTPGWSYTHTPAYQVGIDGRPTELPTQLLKGEYVDAQQKLVDIKQRLINLIRSLLTRGNTTENIEDIYRLIEMLTSVLSHLGVRNNVTCQQRVAVLLLFSSCYFSLLVACEHFVHLLQLDSRQEPQESSPEYLSSSTSTWLPSAPFGLPIKAPAISVGAFRLEMSRGAVAEIHLQLIKQTLQNLQGSMQRQLLLCGAELRNSEDEYPLLTYSIKLNPLASLVEMVLVDLLQQENALIERLGMGTRRG